MTTVSNFEGCVEIYGTPLTNTEKEVIHTCCWDFYLTAYIVWEALFSSVE